jgi:hypothetical protein
MATYLELLELIQDPVLSQRVQAAALVAADTIRAEPPGTPNHAARRAWARQVLANPQADQKKILISVVIQKRALTQAQIVGATDAQLQTAVDDAIDLFAA